MIAIIFINLTLSVLKENESHDLTAAYRDIICLTL